MDKGRKGRRAQSQFRLRIVLQHVDDITSLRDVVLFLM